MDAVVLLNLMLAMMIFIVIGAICAKTGLTNAESNKYIAGLVTNVFQAALILNSAMTADPSIDNFEVLRVLAFGFLMHGFLLIIGFIVPRILKAPRPEWGAYTFMTVFGNVGFIGIPVVSAIYGQGSAFYVSLFVIPFNLLTFSVGRIILGGEAKARALINPTIIASVLAVMIVLTRIPVPDAFKTAAGYLGNASVPCSMLVIGTSLGMMRLDKDTFSWRIFALSAIKLVVCPIAVYYVFKPFVSNDLYLGIAAMLAATPVAAIATNLCITIGKNDALAAKTVFLTTVLSAVTIPLVVYILPL